MFRRNPLRHGHWNHQRRLDTPRFQKVRPSTPPHLQVSACIDRADASREFGLSNLDSVARANLSANLVTTVQAGAFAGALGALPFAERLGRRKSLLIVAVIAFIGPLLQAFAYGNIACFYIGR